MNTIPVSASDPFERMTRQMARMMEQIHKRQFVKFQTGETAWPALNVYETNSEYSVCADLPGVDPKAIAVEIKEGRLRIAGRREVPQPSSQRSGIHVMEIDHGPFLREIDMPNDVDEEHIEAAYETGFLWIRLPKKP